MQLELSFWPRESLRSVLHDFLATQCDDLAEATRADYGERARWLTMVLGEGLDARRIDFSMLENVARRWGPKGEGLKNVTIKRRLIFLRACLKYAQARGILVTLPMLPTKALRDDGERRKAFHTPEQFAVFREQIVPGARRWFCDLGFWTGHHSSDLFTMTCDMFELDEPFEDASGEAIALGRYLRRNHKNPRCQPLWLPLEPEARAALIEIRDGMGSGWRKGAPITGRVWGIHRTMRAAADRAELPRVSPIDLRRSFASMLIARGYPAEYVRHALGHEGENSRTQGGESKRPTTASRHYMQFSPDLVKLRSND